MQRPYIQLPLPEPPPEYIEEMERQRREQEKEHGPQPPNSEVTGSKVIIIQL